MTIRFGNITAGSTYVTPASPARRRQLLELRSMSTQPSTNVDIQGGGIAGTSIQSSNVDISGGGIAGTSIQSTLVDITGGSISGASLASSAINFTGGSIAGTCIATSSLSASSFASTGVDITGGSIAGVILSGSFASSAMYITGGKIDGTPIGATNPSSGNFTAMAASSAVTGSSGGVTNTWTANTVQATSGVSAQSVTLTSAINKVTLTPPTTSATITVSDGKTLTVEQDTTINHGSFATTFTFNGTGTPGTTASVTVQWQRAGNIVSIYVPTVGATSGTGSDSLIMDTAMPASIRPNASQWSPWTICKDNALSDAAAGRVLIDVGGKLYFQRAGGVNYTNGTACGFNGALTLTYHLA